MSDLSRRAFGAILGSGAFVWFDKNYQGNGGTGGGNVTNPEAADIQLDDAVLDVTSDTVTVDVDAANFGGETGDATVLFRDQVEELASQNVTLEAGAVEALQFTNDYTNITADDVTLDVVNDQYPLAVDLTVPRPNIQFTGGRIEDTNGNEITEITEGQTFYVVGTAENTGARSGDKTYVLYGNDTEIDSQLVTLSSGGSTALEFSHSYSNLDLAADETAKQVDLSVNEQGVGEISIFPPAIPDTVELHYDPREEAVGETSTLTAQIGSNDLSGQYEITDNGINAQKTAKFVGSNSEEILNSNISYSGDPFALAFVAQKRNNTGTSNFYFGTGTDLNLAFQDNGNYKIFTNGEGGGPTGGTVDLDPHVITVESIDDSDGNEVRVTVDGTEIILDTAGGDAAIDGLAIGSRYGSNYMDVRYGEIMLLNNYSSQDLKDVRQHLADNWSITL